MTAPDPESPDARDGTSKALLAASPDEYWQKIVFEVDAAGRNARFACLLNHQAAHLLAWAKIARDAAREEQK